MSTRRKHTGVVAAGLMAVMLSPLAVLFSTPEVPAALTPAEEARRLELDDWPLTPAASRGKEAYTRYCSGCHGAEGRGDGSAASFLDPLPRDFQHGAFKFRSTPTGKLPRLADVMHTITCGLPGSAMPDFRLLPEPLRRDLATYVLHVATFKYGIREVESVMRREGLTLEQVLAERIEAIRAEVWRKRVVTNQPIPVPPSPPVTPALLEKGRTIYMTQCNRCHGDTGKGDGPSSYTLRDWKDAPIRARDFTSGVFRAGSAPEDLFRRLRTGLNGTPMPSIPGTDEEIWALVHFMLSLVDPDRAPKRAPVCGHDDGGTR